MNFLERLGWELTSPFIYELDCFPDHVYQLHFTDPGRQIYITRYNFRGGKATYTRRFSGMSSARRAYPKILGLNHTK